MPLTQNKACVSFAESNEYRDRTQSSKMNIHHECWMQLDSDIDWETMLFLVLIAMWSVENSWNQRLNHCKNSARENAGYAFPSTGDGFCASQ